MTSAPHPLIKMDSHYEARVSSEIDIYRDCLDVHNLPAIFHYWSACHISPMLEPHGFSNPRGMFLMALENQCIRHDGGRVSFLAWARGIAIWKSVLRPSFDSGAAVTSRLSALI